MPSWITLVILAIVWCFFAVAYCIHVHLTHAENREVRIFLTVFLSSLLALLFWGLALLVDLWLWPWGQATVITLHGLFAMFTLNSLVIDVWTVLKTPAQHTSEE